MAQQWQWRAAAPRQSRAQRPAEVDGRTGSASSSSRSRSRAGAASLPGPRAASQRQAMDFATFGGDVTLLSLLGAGWPRLSSSPPVGVLTTIPQPPGALKRPDLGCQREKYRGCSIVSGSRRHAHHSLANQTSSRPVCPKLVLARRPLAVHPLDTSPGRSAPLLCTPNPPPLGSSPSFARVARSEYLSGVFYLHVSLARFCV